MKKLLIAALLLCPAARADEIFNFAGTIHQQPGETFRYWFTVDEFTNLVNPDGSLFIADVLNGQVLIQDGRVGCHPCGATYINDIAEFQYGESLVLASFGNWELIGTSTGVLLVDPPVATPEPSMLLLLGCGVTFLLSRLVLRQLTV